MVRPVPSKRKLFNNNKDQFKENEPDQIISSNSETFVTTKTHSHSSSLLLNKSLNSSKKSPAECSSRGDRKRDKDGLSCGDWQKRCESEDGGTTLTTGRTAMPMSERQQIALLMQLSSPSPTNKSERSSRTSPQTPTTPHFGRGVTKRNERGETPLHVAAIKGDCEKVDQLISQGSNVNATDYAGWTALHEACNRGFLVIASLLIKGGADVNAKGLDNDTPLHDACVNNHFQIVRLLLRSGAKTNSANCRGKTPLDVCRSPRILSLLEEANSGDLSFDSPEKDISRIKIQDFDLNPYERDYPLSNKSTSPDHPQTFEMSRKTPPNNKIDEKPVAPSSTPSSVASNAGGGGGTPSGNGASIGNNGRPVSPRVTLRLPHVPRTPDKSQQRTHETKNSSESEDVYEFRCTKEESKVVENEEKTEGGSAKPPETSSDPKGDKRPRENDPESDEEGKKRRRKEESKESAKNLGRGVVTGSRSSSSEKALKVGQRASSSNGSSSKQFSTTTTTSTCSNTNTSSLVTSTITNISTVSSTSSSDQRKSPSTVSSPKPSTGISKASPEKMDSDSDDTKNENSSGAPKVPPLKIVLAPCGLSEQETSSINGKNGSNRQLPYVVNSSSGNTEEKESASSSENKELPIIKEESGAGSSNVSSGVGTMSANTTNNTPTISISTFGSATITSLSSGNGSSGHMNTSTTISTSSSSSIDKASATRITRSQRGCGSGSGSGSSSSYSEDQVTIKMEPKTEDHITTDVVHPRKRKIKMKEPEMEQLPPVTVPEQPVTNCYEMFLKIRKQVERRRKLLFPVQPKPPQGFKDYLMNRCSYVLANSSNSQLSVPLISAPAALSQPLKDLFTEQEQERYKLRLQQLIEKEKLVLSVEQEILRVHGRAARALANQVVPFSVCTILKDEEVYNVISPEQEEKDRNARSRYNGRLFLSWLQDVDDKWEKIKEAMVLRHHNEAESLHAVQKMDWEWKLKENGILEPNSKIQIDELHVPMVQVADFDLLPA